MNVQTERLENHTARFTVAVEQERWEKAKKRAAQKISKQYRIPGFRPGKVPYNVLVKNIGEAPIVEDAIEDLGNEVYRDALSQSELRPYAAGSLDDFQLEPEPTYTFTVPLEPEVDLKEYSEVREDYEVPEVTDTQVDNALTDLRRRHALIEESSKPAAAGDRVTMDIHAVYGDGPEAPQAEAEEAEDEVSEDVESSEADESTEEPQAEGPYKGDHFFHQHGYQAILDPDDEPIVPGIVEALVGVEKGETREFELTIPDDPSFEGVIGRKVKFEVEVSNIETVTLPELNDDFAARVTEDMDEKMTLLELRVFIRDNLIEEMNRMARESYAERVLDAISEQADVSFPPNMVEDRIDDMLQDLDRSMREQGITLEDYIKMSGVSVDSIRDQYRESAEKSVRRMLVITEVGRAEQIRILAEDIEKRIDEMVAPFKDRADAIRPFFESEEQVQRIASQALYEAIIDRVVQIGRGEVTAEEAEAEEAEEAPEEAEVEATVEDDGAESGEEPEAAEASAVEPEETDTPAQGDAS